MDDMLKAELVAVMPGSGEHRTTPESHISRHQHIASLGGKPARGGARWEGEELVIELWLDAGNRELHLCDYWSLASDGQELTVKHRNDDLAGQRTVFRKMK